MKNLIILSAPSGTGKTTLCKSIQKVFPEIKWSISYTTRLRGASENDGQDYRFISRKGFEKLIKDRKLAEWENVHGALYGTVKETLIGIIEKNKFLLLELDVKGALKLKKMYPQNTFSIFIIPPTYEDLKKRLISRNTETEEVINIRLKRFKEEITYKSKFDYVMYNDKLSVAVDEVIKIVKKIKQGEYNGIKNITI